MEINVQFRNGVVAGDCGSDGKLRLGNGRTKMVVSHITPKSFFYKKISAWFKSRLIKYN